MMMQQQREKGEDIEHEVTKPQYVYCYSIKKFWFSRLQIFSATFTIFIWPWTIIVSKKNIPDLYKILLFALFFLVSSFVGGMFLGWRKTYQGEQWIRKNRQDVFLVDDEGIEWQNEDKTVYIRWDEVVQAYIQNGMYVLVKKGAGEEEIRFWNTAYLVDTTRKWASRKLLRSLVTDYCPLLQDNPWESREEETIAPTSSKASYQIAGAQVFSYQTKSNKSSLELKCIVVVFLVDSLIFWTRKETHTPPQISLLLLGLVGLIAYVFYLFHWQWYRKSQIETDDMGIALVEPKGIKWRVLWFTVEKYTEENRQGVLTAKDGKIYKFPLNTARKDELHEEIMRRITTDKQL
jgi:hypothetical protein